MALCRPRSPKVRAENVAEGHASARQRHYGECVLENRLEQRWEPQSNLLWPTTGMDHGGPVPGSVFRILNGTLNLCLAK